MCPYILVFDNSWKARVNKGINRQHQIRSSLWYIMQTIQHNNELSYKVGEYYIYRNKYVFKII